MRASDIINQLLACLPLETDWFTDTIPMTSMAYAAPTLTVNTTGPHGLKIGNRAALVGVSSPIDISSFTRTGQVGTITVARAHDRTYEGVTALDVVTVSGAVESEFNGTFILTGVPDRLTLTVAMADPGPSPPTSSGPATGSPVAEDIDREDRSYNRLMAIDTVPTTSQFTVVSPITGADAPLIPAAELRVKPRISGAVSLDRAIETYTAQKTDKSWAYVVLGDAQGSRGQEHKNDAVDVQTLNTSYRQQVACPFSVIVFSPAINEVAARRARDRMTDLWAPLSRCLLGKTFPTALGCGNSHPVNFVGHGFLDYTNGYYVHGFSYEAIEELGFDDTVGYNTSVAFRDVVITADPDIDDGDGEGELVDNIDLDEVI